MKVDVLHIAKLANIKIERQDLEKYEKQLSSILEYINKLKKVNTEKVEETSQTTGLENVTRLDVTSPSLSQKEALANTKSNHNGFFKVNAILNNET